VQAIAKNAHRLGMSMNAMAKGHQQEVGGRRVFWVDELNLMGANILYSDKATYRKTRLLAAQGLPEEDLSDREILLLDFPVEAEPVPIAASAQEEDEVEPELSPGETGEILEEETMSEEIKEQLQAMSRTLSDVVGTLNGTVTQLSSEIEALKTQVRDVRQDYETRQTVAAQAAEEARKEEEQKSLVQLMRAEIEAVHKRYNPSGSPTRSTHRTVPVAAGAQSPGLDGEQMQLQLQLAAIDGQLTALQSTSNYDPAQVMQLLDRKRDLQVQLQGQGGY
jgi:archaellum component FlaC